MDKALTRRSFIGAGTAALATTVAAAAIPQDPQIRSGDHHLPNESKRGTRNTALDDQNPSSDWAPESDAGGQPPFKYSFSLAHKRLESGGWTRQVTMRDLPIAKKMAGVQMRLIPGGIRELHWHVGAEWALMLYGNARITAVDTAGRSHVSDVQEGDLWLFPGGIPHSIQGLGPDGCFFLLVFDDGNFNEFETFLLTDWIHHTPPEVLAKNFGVAHNPFPKCPKEELFIFASELPRPLAEEQKAAEAGTGRVPNSYDFRPQTIEPLRKVAGGEVKIIDARNWPGSTVASAIVTLKPGGLRELHWHPNEDEWQYYVSGKGRMTVFTAGGHARTMDFQEGDVGYVEKSRPHYIENTGDKDLVFVEVFPTPIYQDISLAEWLAHTPSRLVSEHLKVSESTVNAISKREAVIVPG